MKTMKSSILTVAALMTFGSVVASAATAETKKVEMKETKVVEKREHKKVEESQASMMKEAKITMAAARKIAEAKVPNGKMESGEIEREHGKLIYSFDMRTSKDVTEVNIDAMNGKIVAIDHENAKKEAAETKAEAAEKAAAKKH